jgi:hypothetical protein
VTNGVARIGANTGGPDIERCDEASDFNQILEETKRAKRRSSATRGWVWRTLVGINTGLGRQQLRVVELLQVAIQPTWLTGPL